MKSEKNPMVGTTLQADQLTVHKLENSCIEVTRKFGPTGILQAILILPEDQAVAVRILREVPRTVFGQVRVHIWTEGDEYLREMFDGHVPVRGEVVAKFSVACMRIAADIIVERLAGTTIPLDDWVDEVGLRGFVNEHLKVHLRVMASIEDPAEQEDIARLVMISLRQELRLAGWTPPVVNKIEEPQT